MIDFTIPIDPVPKGRPRFGHGRAFTDPKTRKFEADFARFSSPFKPKDPLQGPLQLSLTFKMRKPKRCKRRYPHVRPDIDNLTKSVVDALRSFWVDDGQIVLMVLGKLYDAEPSIRVSLLEVLDAE